MFSDVSMFCLHTLDGRVKVWQQDGECYSDCCIDQITAFGGGSNSGGQHLHYWQNLSLLKVQCCVRRF